MAALLPHRASTELRARFCGLLTDSISRPTLTQVAEFNARATFEMVIIDSITVHAIGSMLQHVTQNRRSPLLRGLVAADPEQAGAGQSFEAGQGLGERRVRAL